MGDMREGSPRRHLGQALPPLLPEGLGPPPLPPGRLGHSESEWPPVSDRIHMKTDYGDILRALRPSKVDGYVGSRYYPKMGENECTSTTSTTKRTLFFRAALGP